MIAYRTDHALFILAGLMVLLGVLYSGFHLFQLKIIDLLFVASLSYTTHYLYLPDIKYPICPFYVPAFI